MRRVLPAGMGRVAALVLALLFLPPTTQIVTDEIGLTVAAGEVWPVDMLWGYYFSALAIAALVGALVLYERDRPAGRVTLWPALLGFLSTWLQPWEGPLVLEVVIGAELVLELMRRRSSREIAPGPGRRISSASWVRCWWPRRCRSPTTWSSAGWKPAWSIDPGVHDFLDPPWWAIFVTIAPLAIPALLAYRRLPTNFHEAALRVWPVAALGIYWFLINLYTGTTRRTPSGAQHPRWRC